ncbi:MAG: hypothetical protein HY934_00235 [Candidatus Firestonebacteria bacterium]|nr:hypothetical protein [Candidatus Firestonebacteria bacterium]
MGTLYGFSRFSSTCLVNGYKGKDKKGKESFSFNEIYNHFETIYYEIALLTYFQRAALLKFSKEAAKCADEFKQSDENVYKNIKKLKEDFLLFTNKYWFIEITGQEQGIDIHNKWSDVVKNNQLFEEVRQELSELHEYIEIIQANDENIQANKLNLLMGALTILATIGLILSLWIGFFSISIPDKIFCIKKESLEILFYLAPLVICSYFSIYIYRLYTEVDKRKQLVEKTKNLLKEFK